MTLGLVGHCFRVVTASRLFSDVFVLKGARLVGLKVLLRPLVDMQIAWRSLIPLRLGVLTHPVYV